jgi:hypothetical protein
MPFEVALGRASESAKLKSERGPVLPYIPLMTIRQPQDPEIIRRIEVSLPPHLLNELDSALSGRRVHVSRSRVIAVAIRRFLDDGGVKSLPLYPDWP